MLELDSRMEEIIRAQYDFKNIKIRGNVGGLSALNYVVQSDKGNTLILKRYHSRDEEDVKYIEDITSFFGSHSLPVVLPIRTNKNKFHFKVGEHFFAFFPKVKGNVLHEESLTKEALESTALLLSDIHRLASVCDLDLEHTKNAALSLDAVAKKAEAVYELICQHPLNPFIDEMSKELVKVKLNFLSTFAKFTYSFDQHLSRCDLIHGDFHNENLLFDKNKKLAYILDFEETHYGHRMEDIIQFIDLACCNTGYSPENFNKACFFLEAYSSQNFVTEEELTFGIQFYLLSVASSFFFENKLYTERDTNLVEFIKRDLNKLIFFKTHMNDFVKNLITPDMPKIKF